MDAVVVQAMARWPKVPAVYGWLSLDRRGNWLIKGERVANQALREFIGRNYEADEQGKWYFQNGPQRVYVALAYTPLVVHFEGEQLFDHCGRPFDAECVYVDDEGSVLIAAGGQIALLDDRDLERYADEERRLEPIRRQEVAERFRFVPEPAPK